MPAAAREFGLRQHTARGTLINAAFQIGFALLNLVRRLVVAAFLTVSQYAIWGILLVTLFLVVFIKDAGVADKFVQQAEDDQEVAFQKAFSVDLLLSAIAVVLAWVAVPIFAVAYGHTEIIVPGLLLSLAFIGSSLQSPIWIFYRQMDFVRQRTLQAIDPCVAFAVTVALAAVGLGYWSVVIGALTGSFAGAAFALRACPYRLGIRLERKTLGEYFHFSWPLVVASAGGLATVQAALLIATRTIGLAGAGAISLAGSVTTFAHGVDSIVTSTVYPAVCAVRDRAELLFEAFVKSNRLAIMWGMPFGLGLALFAPDLVHFVFGDRWEPAIVVIRAFGLVAAIDQLGFNWTAFLRALGRTRPIATLAVLNIAMFAFVTAPLLILFGLKGFALGWLIGELVHLGGRTYFLAQLFSGFRMLRHMVRAISPSVLPVALLLLARSFESGERTAGVAVAELVGYGGLTLAATLFFERKLLREVIGYLRRRTAAEPQAAGAG